MYAGKQNRISTNLPSPSLTEIFQGNIPGFQSIADTFVNLAAEKEAQQHYLKEMLELVDTGILAYDMETHESLWMNDSLRPCSTFPISRISTG